MNLKASPPSGAPSGNAISPTSLDSVLLAASLTRSWSRRDWPAVRKIMFGWTTNILLFYGMLFGFLLYGCELLNQGSTQRPPSSLRGWPAKSARFEWWQWTWIQQQQRPTQ